MAIPSNTWWRFSEYEIRDGYIRPAVGAAVDAFDPWAAFWQKPEGHIAHPPYMRLVNLVRELPAGLPYEREFTIDANLEHGIVEWCVENGLLGLLSHQVLWAHLGHRQASRSAGPWFGIAPLRSPGEPKRRARWEAIIEPLAGEPRISSLDPVWFRFFPDVPRTRRKKYNYPLPLTDEFWHSYGEPLSDFVRVARWLANAVLALSNGEVVEGPEEELAPGEKPAGYPVLNLRTAVARLNGLTSGVREIASLDDQDRPVREWRAFSLLGILAMQATINFLGEWRIVICPCGESFTTANRLVKYCPEHSDLYRQRDYRARMKEERAQWKSRVKRPRSR